MISTYSGLIPLLAGVCFGRRRSFAWFSGFIAYGLLTDFLVMTVEDGHVSWLIQYLYSLVDFLFLTLFCLPVIIPRLGCRAKILISAVIFMLWFFAHQLYDFSESLLPTPRPWFEAGYGMLLAIISAWGLVRITEKGKDSPHRNYFWFLIGIFFYNFCSFFIQALSNELIALQFWFVHNIVNVLTMCIYTIAFVCLRNENKDPLRPDMSIAPS
jgi:hypothetical protein